MTVPRSPTWIAAVLAATLPAFAQSADLASVAPVGEVGSRPRPAVPTTEQSGSTLFDNGPYVTQTGVGAGGADVSEVEPGLTLFGWGHQFTLGYRVADDFDVPSGQTWRLDQLLWHAYQTNAPTTGTITGIYNEYVAGNPNAAVVLAGDTTTNRLLSVQWTGVYRVTTTTLMSTQRAIMEVTADASFVPPLGSGNYWIRTMVDGTATSGPWAPVTVPWDSADDLHQELGIGAGFNPTTQGFGGTPGDTPFRLVGRSSGPIGTFCTQTKPTSVAGCLPVLSATSTSVSLGRWQTKDVPLGPGTTAIAAGHIFRAGPGIGQSTFTASNAFGTLCLQSPKRALPLVIASGPSNSCTGFLDYDFAGNFASLVLVEPALMVGNDINVQGWYRDPPNAGGANFTNAIWYTLTP